MAIEHFRLPDVGEGLTEADILQWHVAVGDTVEVNQIIVEIETAKAAVELPSPSAGVVTELLVQVGDTVPVGQPLIAISTEVASEVEPAALLVGYGPRDTALHRRRRVQPLAAAADMGAQEPVAAPVLAKPPVRKLAKSLGVDLAAVAGSGDGGIITRVDVEAAAAPPVPAAVSDEPEQHIPVRGVLRQMASAMTSSAFTVPHVTVFHTIDMTATMQLRDRVNARPEFAQVRTSPLLFVARAVLLALRGHPLLNSAWQDEPNEIIVKSQVNLGFAAATDRGLIVPNIKDAQRLSLRELAQALSELTSTARAGRTSPAALRDGTFTISNVGVFGVDSGTPIITPGESAILAFGAVRRLPWVVTSADGVESIEPRWVTQLALSFDHRHIDGEQGSRFLADVGAILSDPGLAIL